MHNNNEADVQWVVATESLLQSETKIVHFAFRHEVSIHISSWLFAWMVQLPRHCSSSSSSSSSTVLALALLCVFCNFLPNSSDFLSTRTSKYHFVVFCHPTLLPRSSHAPSSLLLLLSSYLNFTYWSFSERLCERLSRRESTKINMPDVHVFTMIASFIH